MKTSITKWIGFLFMITVISYLNPLHAEEVPDYITISGVVKDAKTKRKLEFVNVAVPGTNVGTVTNADGEFAIKVRKTLLAEKIELTHIGYKNTVIDVQEDDIDLKDIFLVPIQNLLGEIVVRARDPRFLVEEAMNKIAVNYSDKHNMLTGFYRETAQKGKNYINVSEAIIDIYKTPYDENATKDRVQIFKGRSLLSQKKAIP